MEASNEQFEALYNAYLISLLKEHREIMNSDDYMKSENPLVEATAMLSNQMIKTDHHLIKQIAFLKAIVASLQNEITVLKQTK
jgi:hypothetical protein